MAIGFDSRPHTLGDCMLMTGTWENGDTSIDLSEHFSVIFMAFVAPSTTTEQANPVSIVGTTLHFTETGGDDGVWSAIGKR